MTVVRRSISLSSMRAMPEDWPPPSMRKRPWPTPVGRPNRPFLLRDVAVGAPLASFPLPMTRRPARDKLEHEIYVLGKIIEANASTLTSKTMNDEDREALQ